MSVLEFIHGELKPDTSTPVRWEDEETLLGELKSELDKCLLEEMRR